LQALLVGWAAAAIYLAAFMVTGSRMTAAAALLLALAAGDFRSFPGMMLSENVAFPAFTGFLACAIAWSERRGNVWLAAPGGALLAVAALARPSYLYLVYAACAAMLLLALVPRTRSKGTATAAAAFAAAAVLVLAPWMIRNHALFGDAALTAGYAPFTLAQRVAYNAMTWKEWLIAWVYWLPDFGDNLAKAIFDKGDWVRLGWTGPTSFYLTGAGKVFSDTLAAAGSAEAHLSYLLDTHVLGDLGKHVAVTLPLTWRGLFAGGYVGLAGLLLAWPFVHRMTAEGRLAPLLALALPLLFMAGLHGFVSVNIVRYNEAMIALWATIVAWVLVELWKRVAK
jgi:hypothetical protein